MSAITETPVEIWREIIDQTLFDPILYLSNPFYPGCNPHTALSEWCDTRPLLKQEVQRGILRLVSRSWKYLVDSSRWQYFEANCWEDTTQRAQQSQAARRLEYYRTCSDCGRICGSRPAQCYNCADYVDCIQNKGLISSSDICLFKAEILRLPCGEETLEFIRSNTGRLKTVFPHLRALFISFNANTICDILELVSSATFLSLQIDSTSRPPPHQFSKENHDYISLPVKTLQLLVSNDAYCDLLKEWDMPFLAHLEWRAISSPLHLLSRFLANIGKNLVTLHIYHECDYLTVSQNIWKLVPVLEYFGATEFKTLTTVESSLPPPPPPGHPLHTFAILEEETHLERSRIDALWFVKTWEGLKIVADSHSWANLPPDFINREVLGAFESDHVHRESPCWQCILPLHVACEERGLRYEDRSGITFSEFQETSLEYQI